MLIELPVIPLILTNILGWFILQTGLAWGATYMPITCFKPAMKLFRSRCFEQGGRLYEKCFFIKLWKHHLPEGARYLRRGFRKKKLTNRDPQYLRTFCAETCRAEAAHWAQLACAPLFFMWNPPWAGCVMIIYALAANMPCIMAQRYNRIRLLRIQTSKFSDTKGTS